MPILSVAKNLPVAQGELPLPIPEPAKPTNSYVVAGFIPAFAMTRPHYVFARHSSAEGAEAISAAPSVFLNGAKRNEESQRFLALDPE